MEDINTENRGDDIPREDIGTSCQRVTKDEKKEKDVGDQDERQSHHCWRLMRILE